MQLLVSQGAGEARPRRHGVHTDRLPPHPGPGPDRQFRPAVARRGERGRARAGDHADALREAEAGLALWRGRRGRERRERRPRGRVALRARPRSLARASRVGAGRLARHGRHAGGGGTAGPCRRGASTRRGGAGRAAARRGRHAGPVRRAHALRGVPPRAARRARHGSGRRAEGRPAGAAARRGAGGQARRAPRAESAPRQGRGHRGGGRLLRPSRAVTVVGPGGLGKTRLAHAVSRRADQRVVYFVPLAGVTADEDVAAEVASALGAGDGRHAAISGHSPSRRRPCTAPWLRWRVRSMSMSCRRACGRAGSAGFQRGFSALGPPARAAAATYAAALCRPTPQVTADTPASPPARGDL